MAGTRRVLDAEAAVDNRSGAEYGLPRLERLLDPNARREVRTSRPLMMSGVGWVSRHSQQVTLRLTIAHSESAGRLASLLWRASCWS